MDDFRAGKECVGCNDFLSVHTTERGGEETELADEENLKPKVKTNRLRAFEGTYLVVDLNKISDVKDVCGEDEQQGLEQLERNC